jgi:hypothetical protein
MQLFHDTRTSIRGYDTLSVVNPLKLRPMYHRLKLSPHTLHFVNREWKESISLYPSLEFLLPDQRRCLERACDFMPNPAGNMILKVQRVPCHAYGESRVISLLDPAAEVQVEHVGILCVSRENVYGALQTFDYQGTRLQKELRAGDMVIAPSGHLQHSVANVTPAQPSEDGYIDFLTILQYI